MGNVADKKDEQGGRKTIYTLGTSTRTLDEFFSILEAYGIKSIADVRRFPKSTRYAYFNRESLESEAEKRGLAYSWLGDLLGGFRTGGYEKYQKEEAYLGGVDRLEDMGRQNSTLFICAERLPWKCHRRFIAQSLMERGWEIVHIIEKDRTWQPKDQSELWGEGNEKRKSTEQGE
jgi:uncharacterized protein (DUF488 family)